MDADQLQDVHVSFEGVSKTYRAYSGPDEWLHSLRRGSLLPPYQSFNAVTDLNLTIRKGERIGILGENGSGKSTLLKLMAGVLTPTEGHIRVSGRISALLELGTGFGEELTGLENIQQFALLHGLSQSQIDAKIGEIVEFSELQDFIDHKLKTYSTGMAMRLGFSCAVAMDPEILIIDEALGVGDAYFRYKCLRRINRMLDDGVTFIYVTHNDDNVRSLCERAFLMANGRMLMDGKADAVANRYRSLLFEKMNRRQHTSPLPGEERDPSLTVKEFNEALNSSDITARISPEPGEFRAADRTERAGNGDIHVTGVTISNQASEQTDLVNFDDDLFIDVTFHIANAVPALAHLAVDVTNMVGSRIVQFNSFDAGLKINELPTGSENTIRFSLRNSFCPGEYLISVIAGAGERDPHHDTTLKTGLLYDYHPGAAYFAVPRKSAPRSLSGYVSLPYSAAWRRAHPAR